MRTNWLTWNTFHFRDDFQEERIATLEKRYLNAQRESTSLHDLNEKLEQELQHREAQLRLQEEKIRATQEKLDLSDQKLAQFSKLPDMEEELKMRLHALTQVSFISIAIQLLCYIRLTCLTSRIFCM